MPSRRYAIRICSDEEPVEQWRRGAVEDCPNVHEHTLCPSGYIAWHAWADRMRKTHRQRRCPGCSRLSIWEPRP